VIIGNPPYLGSRYLAKEHGYDYARALHKLYSDVPKMADYCVHWFRRSHDHLPEHTKNDPFAGRAGLVGTNNVRTGASRVASLDYVLDHGGTIVEAVSSQPWSGDAAVHVSIVNWVKGEAVAGPKRLYMLKGSNPNGNWTIEEVARINGSLQSQMDVSAAVLLPVNAEPKRCFVGQYPFNEGFLLTPSEAKGLLEQEPTTRDVVFPYLIGRDLVEDGKASRWIIDFARRNLLEAGSYRGAFERVKRVVMPVVLAKAGAERKATGKETTRWTRMAERWWQFRDWQPGTMAAIASVRRYIACSRVTKRPIFDFVSRHVHPDNTVIVFSFADDYSFGILQSAAHWRWFVAKCSTLTERFRYTSETVFDTFPWPQSPTAKQIETVAALAVEVRRVRAEALKVSTGGLRAVYRTLELPGRHPLKDAHAALDSAVLAAYGFDPKKDLLAQLLDLNLDVAARIDAGRPVTAPGVPPSFGDEARLITEDCIRP
jgi:hypothetical protein